MWGRRGVGVHFCWYARVLVCFSYILHIYVTGSSWWSWAWCWFQCKLRWAQLGGRILLPRLRLRLPSVIHMRSPSPWQIVRLSLPNKLLFLIPEQCFSRIWEHVRIKVFTSCFVVSFYTWYTLLFSSEIIWGQSSDYNIRKFGVWNNKWMSSQSIGLQPI